MDFTSLAAELLARSESVVAEWLPEGRRRGHEYTVGDLNGSPGDSLSINLNTGVWKDFSTGEAGGDLISLYAAINRLGQGDAYKHLTNGKAPVALSRPAPTRPPPEPDPTIIIPVPADAPLPSMRHSKHGEPVASWCYRTPAGEVIGHVARYEPGGRKQIVPWVYTDLGWSAKAFPRPRPLYGLELLAMHPDRLVMIVEGEKAADAARRLLSAWVVVTWPGGSQAIRYVDWRPLHGRDVCIWPDADDPGTKAAEAIAEILHGKTKRTRIIDVSDHTDGWDAADAESSRELSPGRMSAWASPRVRTLWEASQDLPPETPPPRTRTPPGEPHSEPGGRPLIFSSTPLRTAELFHELLPEGGRILFWRGEFYSWDGTRYVVRDRVYIEQRLYRFMDGCETWRIINKKTGDYEVVPFAPTSRTVADVFNALRAVCYADLPEPQCWIEQRPSDYPAHEIIAFRNGFLHHPTRTLMPATDRLFVINALQFDYLADAPAPTEWLEFLASLWRDDQQSIDVLAEMMGYLLTDDTRQQKMFMLVGPSRSGKGTILRVLEALVGHNNRVSPSLASLGTQFGLQPLIGKRLAMISDARLSGRADQQPIVENLLRITGEDSLTIDRKNIASWSGKLPTRFVIAANELPAFSDASAALANRFIIWKFTRSFLGQEDHGLTSRLLSELSGIVLWALDGLQDLRDRGYFVRPDSAEDLVMDMLEQSSPIRTFVDECCVLGVIEHCDRDDLFMAWRLWCETQGRDHPGIKAAFGRNLNSAFPEITRYQPRDGGTRANLYRGVGLNTEWLEIVRRRRVAQA